MILKKKQILRENQKLAEDLQHANDVIVGQKDRIRSQREIILGMRESNATLAARLKEEREVSCLNALKYSTAKLEAARYKSLYEALQVKFDRMEDIDYDEGKGDPLDAENDDPGSGGKSMCDLSDGTTSRTTESDTCCS